jgi:hypothetical protein
VNGGARSVRGSGDESGVRRDANGERRERRGVREVGGWYVWGAQEEADGVEAERCL